MEKELQQIDPVTESIKKAVRYILQTEIADRVWYQDRGCEEQLQKGLDEAEKKMIDYVKSIIVE